MPDLVPHSLYEMRFPDSRLYIGVTSKPEHRWRQHERSAANGSRVAVHCAIRKCGFASVQTRILAIGPEAYILALEIAAIQAFGSLVSENGYNVSAGGVCNAMHNPEVRARIARALTGRKLSPALRKKLSDAHNGKKDSSVTIKKKSIAATGRLLSPAARAKISAAHKGRLWSEERKTAYRCALAALPVERKQKRGEAWRGRKHTDQARKKISERLRLGDSPERRARNSAAQKGKMMSSETRAKISAALARRTITPETRAKLRAAALRRVQEGTHNFLKDTNK